MFYFYTALLVHTFHLYVMFHLNVGDDNDV